MANYSNRDFLRLDLLSFLFIQERMMGDLNIYRQLLINPFANFSHKNHKFQTNPEALGLYF